MSTATAVKERPILFSGEMVRAILSGQKTVTRRVIKPIAGMSDFDDDGWPVYEDAYGDWHRQPCPYGEAGDRLWVRETWRRPNVNADTPVKEGQTVVYRATSNFHDGFGEPWRPSIFMRRWMSRITLEVVSVRAERVQEITEEDAVAEGFAYEAFPSKWPGREYQIQARGGFRSLWDKLNAKRGFAWDANPYVWRVEFRRLESA